MNEQVIYAIALAKSLPMDFVAQRVLLEEFGSAKGVYEHRHSLTAGEGKSATGALANAVAQMELYFEEAREELRWASDFGVDCLTLDGDCRYPKRLRECPDAPAVLYHLGGADLNADRVVSVVGTRQCTEYGRTLCRRLMADLARLCPGTLVVSGLAYGIDVAAHLMALECGLPTVGVLAHGLEQIYPSAHRHVANQMIDRGGLVTEYCHGSRIAKVNFVSRNRIVAGMADAVVVVESKRKGGSLITARLANEYNREVTAVPGRAFDEHSEGCNNLIRDNKAHLIDSAEDLISIMGWAAPENTGEPQQRELFPPLSEEEQKVVLRLREDYEGKDLNQLEIATGIPVVQLLSVLFDLAEKGIIHQISGGRYAML